MRTRAEVAAAARGYVGTPFHHQGRLKGVGIDCAGLVVGVAHELGLSAFDYTEYAHRPHASLLERLLDANMDRVSAWGAGDVLLLAFDGDPQHLAVVTELAAGPGIVHAYAPMRRCVEHRLDGVWRARIRGAFRFRGVD